MDLGFTEEQEILKKSAHNFLAKECPKKLTKELDESETGFSPELWKKMADLGWMGSILPEEYGGSGGNYLDLIVLLEEMGYNLLPGPFFSTMVLGALPILSAGTEKQKELYLPAIAGGEKIFTMALTEVSGKYDAASVAVKATPAGDGYVISGLKLFVPDAHLADYILCVARTKDGADPEDGITLFIVDGKAPGIKTTLLKTLARDKQTEVVFDQVKVGQGQHPGRAGLRLARCQGCFAEGGRGQGSRARGPFPGGAGDGRQLCQGKSPVRATHRKLPGDPALLREHAFRCGQCALPHL